MLGDPVKRLEYTSRELAKRVSPQDRFDALVDIVKLFAELLDHFELYFAAKAIEADAIEWQYNAPVTEMDRAEVWDEFTARLIQRVRDANLGKTPLEKFIQWLAREHKRLASVKDRALLREGLADWHADTKADVMKMSARDVVAAVDEWLTLHAEETIYEFPNGWTVKKLIGPAALLREGELMHHCVKEPQYAKAVAAGEKVIYSLRDPSNYPHVTMDWSSFGGKRFAQMMMAWNKYPPSEEYRPMLIEFVTQVHDGDPRDLLLTGVKARNLDLRGAKLTSAILAGADLSNMDLTEADLSGANLSNAVLIDADLTRAVLSGANLLDANLTGADLSGANLYDAYLFNADLSGADLTGADLTRADLRGADLIRADLTNAIFDEYTIMPDGTRWSPPAGLGYYYRRRR